MKPISRRTAWGAAALLPSLAAAQTPQRPVTIIVPFPPGGSTDVTARLLAERMSPALGLPVQVENRPTEQYEQVDLVWYYNDGFQVKIGQELVDGKLSIVMGREEADRTRTIAIIPLDSFVVDVRFRVEGNQIRGAYRTPSMTDWKEAGGCDLPVKGAPNVSLQVYQGTTRVERWAKIRAFEVKAL